MNNFLFTKDKELNKKVWSAFKVALKAWGTSGKDVEVTISEHKRHKSYKQLKGYFRLVNMIVPVIKEQNPDHFIDKDVVDNIIKDRYGYYTSINMEHARDEHEEVKTYKSKAKASIEEMMALINTAELLGSMFDLEDCFITSEEELALKEYYNN